MIRKIWINILDFFSDVEDPEEPVYDPVHFASVIVLVLFSIGVLFWLLWTLLVFRGGIFPKIRPAIEVLFGKKTLRDYGWVGWPFELGVFEGFIANTIALILTILLIAGIWWVFEKKNAPPSL